MTTTKLEFLAQLPIFSALYQDELEDLVTIAEEYEFDDGSVIAYQRDVADSLYIVRSGRLFAHSVDERGIVRESRSFLPGDCFGDVWLFVPGAHPATVTGKGEDGGRILVIQSGDFLQFLEAHPDALEALAPEFDNTDDQIGGLSPEAWAEAQKSRVRADRQSSAISLLADELVEYRSRRSRWYLLLRLILPTLGLFSVPLLIFSFLGSQPVESIWFRSRIVVTLVFALVFAAWFAFELLDWLNDYFVITNKHLAHREFSLRTFRTTVNKIPIDQIQSVSTERPNLIANLFNFGTARITTAAQQTAIFFDNIDDPGRVEEVLNELRRRVQTVDAARAQTTMRRSVERHFQLDPPVRPLAEDGDEAEMRKAVPQRNRMVGFLAAIVNRYRWRVEENGVITYRKHFFVLLREVAWPAASLIVASLILFLVWRMPLVVGELIWIVGIFYLILFAWLVWEIEDWRNDTFQLTDRYVFDIDRRPFGFGESRKQAELSNVQNINSDRPNLIATLFNYGNVIIETAGAQADIVFENVSNPNRIQSDIFKRRDRYRRQRSVREGERRREEYAVLLDVYKQATEQDRIPRRTPPDEVVMEE